jgi:hypothetical protein
MGNELSCLDEVKGPQLVKQLEPTLLGHQVPRIAELSLELYIFVEKGVF